MDHPDKYVIVTPVRDEENYLEKTISSVISQTIIPDEWVLVDDGSEDNTGKIIDDYAARYPWIKAVHRANRGHRKAGGGVMEAFYEGYRVLVTDDWSFIVKLDGDLQFEKDYFEKCFQSFEDDAEIGIAGGGIYHVVNGNLQLEERHPFHVRGATKIYRRACWDDIGGLVKAPGWDTLDEVKANMKGWKTLALPDQKVVHLRYTGGAEGAWRDWVKNGVGGYIAGYHPLFMFFKCLSRAFQRPYGLVPVALMVGFVKGYMKQIPRVRDKELIRYLRKEQMNRLLGKGSIYGQKRM